MFLITRSLARGLLPSLFTAGSVISIYFSFCIPLVLGIRELFSIWSVLPGPVMLSAFSNLPLSISCLMFSLAICPVFTSSPASVLSLLCYKLLKDVPSGKQDVFHILKLETIGTCSLCSQQCLPNNQCERICFVATQAHRLKQSRKSVFRLWV